MGCHKKGLAGLEICIPWVIDGWTDRIFVSFSGLRVDQFHAKPVVWGHSWIRLGLLGCPGCSWKQQRWPAAISARRMNTAMHKENGTRRPSQISLWILKLIFPATAFGDRFSERFMADGRCLRVSPKKKKRAEGAVLWIRKNPLCWPPTGLRWNGKEKEKEKP